MQVRRQAELFAGSSSREIEDTSVRQEHCSSSTTDRRNLTGTE